MSTPVKTIVATGASSGLGFELVRQLLTQQSQAYNFILGARDIPRTQAAYDAIKFDSAKHRVTILPLELADLEITKTFAQQALQSLGQDRVDCLLLNAGMGVGVDKPGRHGSKWCENYIVNYLSQHYLIHLLRDKLVSSSSRIVIVSSGTVRKIQDPSALDRELLPNPGTTGLEMYARSKFVQLLSVHWWRRQLAGAGCKVLAVSPGLVPDTKIWEGSGIKVSMDMPDAKTVSEGTDKVDAGAENILRAVTIDDFPEDPEQVFLTSWGEWWPKDVYAKSLDQELQDKWCLSRDEIEREEGVS
ncbi:WW domain-containing oxidoreductase [Cladorrhinum samala]|uniref:WW domain-containing oxidoreductase n=1 Tax=Cladorrhinum samala TaxID=585594 RepID=A0AAV9I0S6_9PEZI|nr:WW domain-containing oxidoreductase [Cladorrhinum samala]